MSDKLILLSKQFCNVFSSFLDSYMVPNCDHKDLTRPALLRENSIHRKQLILGKNVFTGQ